MYPRRGLLGGRGMSGGFNQVSGGRPGGGGLLGSLGPRDNSVDYNRDFNRGQAMSGHGFHRDRIGFQQRAPMSQGPMMDSGFRRGSNHMGMSKRPGDMDSSWDPKRQRTDRMDHGFDRRRGRGNDGGTEYDPSRPTEDGGQLQKKFNNQRDDKRRSGGPQREYCRTCSKWIDGGFEHHKNSQEHLDKIPRKNVPTMGKGDEKEVKIQKTEVVDTEKKTKKELPEVENKEKPESAEKKTTGKEAGDSNGSVPSEMEEEQEGTVEEMSDNPEYDDQVCFGREYVVPVTGFFCRLCHKFYSSEKTVYDSHCHSRPHYDKYIAELEHLRVKNGSASPNSKNSRGRGIRRGK